MQRRRRKGRKEGLERFLLSQGQAPQKVKQFLVRKVKSSKVKARQVKAEKSSNFNERSQVKSSQVKAKKGRERKDKEEERKRRSRRFIRTQSLQKCERLDVGSS